MWRTPFLISDMLFPVWLVVILVVLLRKGVTAWKAWAIASGAVLLQGYLVAKTIGFNLSFYAILYVGFIPYKLLSLFGISVRAIAQADIYVVWIFPVLIITVLPTFAIYSYSKVKAHFKQKKPHV